MHCPPIGIFDSGIGGLTVYNEVKRLLPDAHLHYLTDREHLPYGDLSPECITFHFTQYLKHFTPHHIQLLVIACYTVSTVIQTIDFPIPIITILDSAHSILNKKSIKRLAVMGTQATIQSNCIQVNSPSIELFPIACPELVPLIEEHNFDEAKHHIQRYGYLLDDYQVDSVLLACTHYPYLLPLMHEFWNPRIDIIDASTTCAQEVVRFIERKTKAKQTAANKLSVT